MAKVTLLPILLIFHVHVYNQLVDLQVLQGEKYLGVECCVIRVSMSDPIYFIFIFFLLFHFSNAYSVGKLILWEK